MKHEELHDIPVQVIDSIVPPEMRGDFDRMTELWGKVFDDLSEIRGIAEKWKLQAVVEAVVNIVGDDEEGEG